uniref:Uncharacterized protein n=1 Tax=Rhizophora mucronata TaxID=61149 RepID=A0A2P2J2B5_RHIMU
MHQLFQIRSTLVYGSSIQGLLTTWPIIPNFFFPIP